MKTFDKNFKKVCIAAILCVVVLVSKAQQHKESVLEQLQGKTWDMQGMIGKTAYEEYSKGQVTYCFNGEFFGFAEYYLSDSIVTVFDPGKVGKITDGKYIVSRIIREKNDPRPVPVRVLEIVQLNKSMLILRYIEHKHVLKYKARE